MRATHAFAAPLQLPWQMTSAARSPAHQSPVPRARPPAAPTSQHAAEGVDGHSPTDEYVQKNRAPTCADVHERLIAPPRCFLLPHHRGGSGGPPQQPDDPIALVVAGSRRVLA